MTPVESQRRHLQMQRLQIASPLDRENDRFGDSPQHSAQEARANADNNARGKKSESRNEIVRNFTRSDPDSR
jgi:hypothetical protein